MSSCFPMVLGTNPSTSYRLDKHFTIELHPQSKTFLAYVCCYIYFFNGVTVSLQRPEDNLQDITNGCLWGQNQVVTVADSHLNLLSHLTGLWKFLFWHRVSLCSHYLVCNSLCRTKQPQIHRDSPASFYLPSAGIIYLFETGSHVSQVSLTPAVYPKKTLNFFIKIIYFYFICIGVLPAFISVWGYQDFGVTDSW